MNQYLSLDGTTKNGSYGASVNYRKVTGLDMVTARQEYGGHFSIQQRGLDNWVELTASLNARKVKEDKGEASWGSALTTNPTMPVWDESTGNYYQPTSPTGASNPKSQLDLVDKQGDRNYLLGSAELKVHILKQANQSLNVSLNHSLNYNDYDYYEYNPSTSADSYWNGYTGKAERKNQKWWTNRTELLGNYTLSLEDHDFKIVAGYSYEESNFEELKAVNSNFAFDQTQWNDLGSGTYLNEGKAEMESKKNSSKLIGVFGRINYNWKDLLMASASYRHEGSTKFGPDNKWGSFVAGSVAWEIANMPFMQQIQLVDMLKPRISYGVTGRSDFDPYLSQQNYKAEGNYYMDGRWVTGYAPAVNANPALAWEKAVVTNIGIDFSFWNRLRGSVEYYDRQSRNLLYNYTAPQPPFVHEKILVNVGTIQNQGFEISLDGDILKKTPVKWSSGIILSQGVTKLKKLSNDVFEASYLNIKEKGGPGSSEYYFRVEEGGKIGQFYGLQTAGVDANGNMLVYDRNDEIIPIGDAQIEDKRFIGNGAPKVFLSWNNTLRYKQFDLNMFWRGAFGFDIYNDRLYGMGLEGAGSSNVLRSAYNTELKHPGGLISSYFLEKGNFFKLENVMVGYNLQPRENKFMNSMRVYLSAKNLFTITNYSGNDPSIVAVNGIDPGVDNSGAYPQAMVFTLGVTINFK
ncbi:MAG: TonB-dependent receptor [Tannerellaceae bacterium]|nr:TonB-dependent receptor [Tannerellaceae bacterium]